MVEREVFVMKPKNQNHLCQWGEYVYGAQSWKEKKIILWIHVYPTWKTNFDSKNGKKWSFSDKTKASKSYHNKENVFIVSNHEKKRDYFVNPCLSQFKDELQF